MPCLSLSERLQYGLEQSPAMINRLDFNLLTWRVCAAYVGAEGNHVQMRMACGEQAAFEACVNHLQAGELAEFCGVDLLTQREQG